MSRKWQRNKQWDREHLVGALTPVRWVLQAFSSIPLAVVLLVFVSVYATLASVPVGLIAALPTYLIYAATLLVAAVTPAVVGVAVVRTVLPRQARGARFAVSLLAGVGLAVAGAGLWGRLVWPVLHYDPATREGLMLFSGFIAEYKSVTWRRMPGMEMTETQFYAWWPMRLALILFVINMIVATVRRIEFNFKNIGVLSVHTGIVLIAVGSVFYQRFKQEGDTLLPAGATGSAVGPGQRSYYDREDVVLYVAQRSEFGQPRFEQRPLIGVPRYNNYGLGAGLPGGEKFSQRGMHAGGAASKDLNPAERAAVEDDGRGLSLTVPPGPGQFVDPDLRFRVVGYAPYATMQSDWVRADAAEAGETLNPLRTVELWADIPGQTVPKDRPVFEFPFFLGTPAQRVRSNDIVAMEFTRGMDAQRWDDLSTNVPVAAAHALVVEVPATGFRVVLPARVGDRLTLGDTGWTLAVKDLAEEPPFPIITKGYEDATSSLAILELTPPPSADGAASEPIERWVFHRFPELNQDLSTSADPATGRPMRGAPDPAIRVAYLDMSRLQVYLDEASDGVVRAIIRQPGGQVRVVDREQDGWIRGLVPNQDGAKVDLRLAERWPHARAIDRPRPVPLAERDISLMGSHAEAMLAVHVSVTDDSPFAPWSKVVWLPFTKYMGIERDKVRTVEVPGGRSVQVAFGRWQRPFPGFSVSLVNFEMIAYDHRGAPRDYQSVVRVAPTVDPNDPAGDFAPYEHLIKLNAPLRAPFHWDPEGSYFFNLVRRLSAGMNPNQFKLSQAGWDRAGWMQSQALVDQGQLAAPRVAFTILGVGNNPGIHVIAFGSVLMGVGIPWAFYIKPWLVRREKERLAEAVRSGKIQTPKQRRESGEAAEVPA
jgi:uncharacterized membrane protein